MKCQISFPEERKFKSGYDNDNNSDSHRELCLHMRGVQSVSEHQGLKYDI